MTDPMSFLEWKHNVLNRIEYFPIAPFNTTTITVTKKRVPKRKPSTKGYGNKR